MKKITIIGAFMMLAMLSLANIITPQIKGNDIIIKHQFYTISFNPKFHEANWSAMEIMGSNVNSNNAKRSNRFIADPLCQLTQATDKDYRKSGYDRGHLSAAEDFDFSQTAMDQSFYYTNVCPQVPGLNRGEWKDLEAYSRSLAQKYGQVWVITGVYFDSYTNYKTIGPNQIGVPSEFWKVIIFQQNGKYQYLCYLMPNQDVKDSFQDYQISLQKFQTETGYNF